MKPKHLFYCGWLACSLSWAVPNSNLISAQLENRENQFRILFQFSTDVPQYQVSFDKKKKTTEVSWKEVPADPFHKDFMIPTENGIKRVVVTVEPKANRGLIRIWQDAAVDYELTRETANSLSLVLPKEVKSQRTPASAPATSAPKAAGKKISLNVKNTPIVKVLRNLAAESNHSLVFGDEVTGNVSANVRNLTYEEAVNTILKTTPYRAENSGDVTVVRSEKLGRGFRSFKLHFIDVSQILKTVQDQISKEGQVGIDTNTNSIFVTDRMDILNNVEQMVRVLDQEPRQVEVESSIVELETKNGEDVGFGFNASIHNGDVTNDISQTQLTSNTPSSGSPKGMFVGLSWQSVSGILSLLATKSKLSVIAKPRVLALSDQEAQIVIGSQIGYKTITVTPSGNVQDVKFITVGTQLKIRPHITQAGDMLMYIRPEISDGSLDQTTQVPNTNTTSSETKVLAKDGQTIVIGGLMRDRLEKTVNKVPILGDIPVLGFLFRGTQESMIKTELVILLSPKIVNGETRQAMDRTGAAITGRAKREIGLSPMQAGMGE